MEIKTVKSLIELKQLDEAGQLIGLFDMPDALYHEGPGISSSGLKKLLRSTAHYEAYKASPPDSAAMRLGRAVHAYLLEFDKFYDNYAVMPDIDRRTKEGKFNYEFFMAQSVQKQIIKSEDHDLCMAISEAVRDNCLATDVLNHPSGVNEVSVYWKHEGILCKARADRIYNGVVFDVKTCQDARADAFRKDVANYAYHLSAAFYVDGFATVMDKPSFSWIAIEKEAPHGIGFFEASKASLEKGRQEYMKALEVFRQYQSSEVATGYPQFFESLDLPGWYK